MLNRVDNIGKISISSINAFIGDKCKWICENIFGCPSSVDQRNPYFWRGSILEAEVEDAAKVIANNLGYNKEFSIERAVGKYDKLVTDNHSFLSVVYPDEVIQKQREFIFHSIDNSVVYKAAEAMGKVVKYQQPLSRIIYNTSFRLTGVADFVSSDSIYEMKTKANVYQIANNHIRQAIYYNYLKGLTPKLLYLSDTEYKVWLIKSQLIKPYMFQVFEAVAEIEKILHMSINDIRRNYKSSLNQQLLSESNYKKVATELWG